MKIAFRERDRAEVAPVPPLVGLVGTIGFFALMLVHLYRSEPRTFVMVVALGDGESLPPKPVAGAE